MKLLFENWRDYIEKGDPGTDGAPWERGGPYVDTSTVKIVEQPMYWTDYLFVVVEYEYPANTGKMKKAGFYRSSGASVEGTEHTAGMWFPTGGIKKEKEWIIKYSEKYPHPDSKLGQVTSKLGEMIPPAEGEKIRRKMKGLRNQQRREQGIRSHEIDAQHLDAVNSAFSKHGVYNETPI